MARRSAWGGDREAVSRNADADVPSRFV